MNPYRTFALSALAGILVFSAFPADRETATPRSTTAPVLQHSEPTDSVLVMLPGRRVPSAPAKSDEPVAPPVATAPQPPEASYGPAASAYLKKTAPADDPPPLLHRAPRPIFPTEFERDSAVFCQQRIGQWSKPDAYNLFGDPLRERPSYSEARQENGQIYAFSDPTGRYRALELDFADTGLLRTVFVYPWSMTWLECRHLWGGKVTATGADDGRTFYSYINRRLDVLVEPGGKVVSLGLY